MHRTIGRATLALGVFMMGCGGPQPAEPTALEATSGPAAKPSGVELHYGALRLVAPATWSSNPPRSDFVLADFNLLPAKGDTVNGRLTVSIVGGSIDDNLSGWRQQFTKDPAEEFEEGPLPPHEQKSLKESPENRVIAGIPVVFVDIAGTYREQFAPPKRPERHPDYRLLGAICGEPADEHHLYIKFYGPARTVAAHSKEFRAFVDSMQVKQP